MPKIAPDQVFTPRAPQVNDRMYVQRAKLEQRLIDAFNANKYIVIHGESGNGKTWLYKKVFAENGIYVDVLNLGQAAATGSLENAFKQKLGEWGRTSPVSQETNSSAGFKPGGMGIDHSMKTSQGFHAKSPFMLLLEAVRYRAHGDKPAALVLDNFESIVGNAEMVRQIGGLIVSADDESFSQFGVQVVIVGVPGNLKEILVNISNSAPVSNRLTEIPEVARMTEREAKDLIRRGFVEQLGLSFVEGLDIEKLYLDISFYTDRIAQHLHELCLIIAQSAARNGDVITPEIAEEALSTWVADTLSSDVGVIEGVMNAIDTKVGRKNQVLYSLGVCTMEDFKTSDIESIVREHFEVAGAALNVSQILSGFASAKHPIIRRAPKQNLWEFVTPKYRMAIRSKLKRTNDGRVTLSQS
ncbi:MAG: hypothetical protein EOO77_10270 [Oxalobacteraceae bacterium]|nr:MAG: hypothetical protein EOO77_10270 [Oxalobacteraceae bacterium]